MFLDYQHSGMDVVVMGMLPSHDSACKAQGHAYMVYEMALLRKGF
jgi:G:T/U-mismatch repair DNA glycosylase